jgi:hypothetical protein
MHNGEAPHRVLRIPMPGPDKKECFIAISFDRALDQVSGAIAEAVSSHGFAFKRVDLSPKGSKWTENVPEGIRDAAVVVAVINNRISVRLTNPRNESVTMVATRLTGNLPGRS